MGNKIIDGNLNVLGTIYQNGEPIASQAKHTLVLPEGDSGILSLDDLAGIIADPFGYVISQPSRDAILFQYVGVVNDLWIIFKAPAKITSASATEQEFRINKTTAEWVYREDSFSKEPHAVVDTTTTLSNYTFSNDVEATYTKSIDTRLKLTIPSSASQGFISLLTLMSVTGNTLIEVDNKSAYATKLVRNNVVIGDDSCMTTVDGKKIIFARCDGVELEVLLIEEI